MCSDVGPWWPRPFCILIILSRSYYMYGPISPIIRLDRGHWAEITKGRGHWYSLLCGTRSQQDQYTGPIYRTNIQDQYTGPIYRTNIQDQYTGHNLTGHNLTGHNLTSQAVSVRLCQSSTIIQYKLFKRHLYLVFFIFYFFPTDTTCQYNLYICYYFIVIVILYLVFTVRTSSLELFVRLLCEINWKKKH